MTTMLLHPADPPAPPVPAGEHHVLLISPFFDAGLPSGGVLYSVDLTREWLARGRRVTVLCGRRDRSLGPLQTYADSGQLAIQEIASADDLRFTHHFHPHVEAEAARRIAAARPDIIHVHNTHGLLAAARAATDSGRPTIYTALDFGAICFSFYLHDGRPEPCVGPESPAKCAACVGRTLRGLPARIGPLLPRGLTRRLWPRFARLDQIQSAAELHQAMRRLLPRFDAVVAPSPIMADRLTAFGVPPERIVPLVYGVSPEKVLRPLESLSPGPCGPGVLPVEGLHSRESSSAGPCGPGVSPVASFRSPGGCSAGSCGTGVPPVGLQGPEMGSKSADHKLRLAFFGNAEPIKGLPVLMEALAALPDGLALQVCAFGGPAVEAAVAAAPPAARRYLTACPPLAGRELAAEHARLDGVLVPSLWHENSPFVVLEALANGTPVIASDVAGICHLIDPPHNGLLLPPAPPAAWTAALLDIARNPARLRRLPGEARYTRTTSDFADELSAIEARLMTSRAPA